jgi:hypothetical protein
VVVRDEQADDGEAGDVEEGEAPEDLFYGGGEALSGVGGFGGCLL